MFNRICLFYILTFLSFNSYGQWNPITTQNTVVCNESNFQDEVRIVKDGHGGCFLVWRDGRVSGNYMAYIQHVDSMGFPTWDNNGIGLTGPNKTLQSSPTLVKDNSGGIIVVFSTVIMNSGAPRDIYAQKISATGDLMWGPDGVALAEKYQREHNAQCIHNGAGGAIVVFEQVTVSAFTNPPILGDWDVWCQIVDSLGITKWPYDGYKLSPLNTVKKNPKIQKDNAGGAYIVWQEMKQSGDYDIVAQHINSNGDRLWVDSGIVICNSVNAQVNPKIDSDKSNGGVYISWVDKRSGVDNDIYIQRVDPVGNCLWANNGVPVCTVSGAQSAVDVCATGNSEGVIVTWKDARSTVPNVYMQRILNTGLPAWTINGKVVCSSLFPQVNPNISGGEGANVLITWQDSVSGDWDIKTQKIDSSGTVLWNPGGVVVCNASGAQEDPRNISDGNGGCIYAWVDKRNDQGDIYIQRIFTSGTADGLQTNDEENVFSCFPNPFTTYLNISSKEQDITSVKIYDVLGKLVVSEKVNNRQKKLRIEDINQLKEGIYFLTICSEKETRQFKIIKSD